MYFHFKNLNRKKGLQSACIVQVAYTNDNKYIYIYILMLLLQTLFFFSRSNFLKIVNNDMNIE